MDTKNQGGRSHSSRWPASSKGYENTWRPLPSINNLFRSLMLGSELAPLGN
jgi:hypothetical protein